jgi:hypothetical protein
MSRIKNALERLRQIWSEMDPGLYGPSPPTLRSLGNDRTEFSWQGHPFIFDRSSRTICRAGKVVAKYEVVRSIGISEHRDEGRTVCWSVFLEIGLFRNVAVGKTGDQTDASIAAAHLATVTGKRVRVL